MAIGLVMLYKVFIKKPDEYFVNEAKRGLNDNFKSTEDWSSNARVYKEGFSIVKSEEGVEIVPQVKLSGIGLLA